MNLQFSSPAASSSDILAPYFTMRPNKTCDTGLLDTFIWKDYYHIRISIVDEKAVLMLMCNQEEYFTALPYCAEEDLCYYFRMIRNYFNEVLHKPLKVYLADEEGVNALGLKDDPGYIVREEEDLKDYLYDAEKLRTLSGRKYQQKRNQINHFMREYEGRWNYRTLACADHAIVFEFLDRWYEQRQKEDPSDSLIYEKNGVKEIVRDCCMLSYHMGGILIDGKLEALSIGTCNEPEQMAVISIEKGNPEFTGIYQLINQQFLLHEFPDVRLVNREDDMGLPGLRQAKMRYHPVSFARKYMIVQKNYAGYKEALTDYYEAEIHTDTENAGGKASDQASL